MNRIIWAGVVIIALGLGTLGAWTAWSNSLSWTLLDAPISLSQGTHYHSADLVSNMNALYAIQINASTQKIPLEDLRCLLGTGDRWNPCEKPSTLRMGWVVSGGGKTIQGDSHDVDGAADLSRTIGLFRVQKGQHYSLDAYVFSDTSNLNGINPHISVDAFDQRVESYAFISGFLRFFCFVIAAIGALVALWGLYEGQRVLAMDHMQTHARSSSAEPEQTSD